MEDKVTPFASERGDAPDAAGAATMPFAQSDEYQKVLVAAHEHLLNAIEDERIDIDASTRQIPRTHTRIDPLTQ